MRYNVRPEMCAMKKSVAMLASVSVSLLLAGCGKREDVAAAPAVEAEPAVSAAPAAPATPAAPPPAVPAASAGVGDDYPVARDACLAAVAKATGVALSALTATEVLWAEAGVGVTVQVPGADAPWSCLSDEQGNVQGAAYTGSEGKL